MATALHPVPGSHAALANPPTRPSLADVRRSLPFPIFVPVSVPAGLVPEPPLVHGTDPAKSSVEIRYFTGDRTVRLRVTNDPAGCCIPSDPAQQGEAVTLPNGTQAHLRAGTKPGELVLWWEQDGTHLTLETVQPAPLTRQALLAIAASMSQSAELGVTRLMSIEVVGTPVELAVTTPILHPTWLPEPMAVAERQTGTTVTLLFFPRLRDDVFIPLRLEVVPVGTATSWRNPYPSATPATIGNRAVSIYGTADYCAALSWVEGGLEYTLIHGPGMGQQPYTCDQLRTIVASMR